MLAGRQWHPAARTSAYGYYLDPTDSRFHVSIGHPGAAAALQQRLGDRVTVERDTPTLFQGSRGNDASPHFGGAFITPGFTDRKAGCSSGFSVVFGDGRRGAVTARHCYEPNFQPNLKLLSGVEDFGQLDGSRVAPFPTFDMARVTQAGQTYTNKIYTDPCCPTQRTVTSGSNPFQGQVLCVSGQLTGARCSITVTNPSGSFCPDPILVPEFGGQCVNDVMVASRPGIRVAQRGDSGGPIYSPSGTANAAIHGILIGGTSAGDTIFAEKLSNIETALDVDVAVS